MKEIKKTADIANATAIDLGPLSEIKDYVLELGPGVKIPGKVFGGAPVKAGGADFSFQVFAPGTEGGFYHTHKEHEELYFFLSGEGEYQVDGTNIPVREGSVVRVAPAGKRGEDLLFDLRRVAGIDLSAKPVNDRVFIVVCHKEPRVQ